MKSRLPEHFLLNLADSLAPEVKLMAVWALKTSCRQAENDSIRSLVCQQLIKR